jgi:hypothetical protein
VSRRLKPGDRIRTIHPAGHDLLGVVVDVIDRRPIYDGEPYGKRAKYIRVDFDHGAAEWVAIELIDVIKVRSNTAAGEQKERVIELGERLPQPYTDSELEPSPLTLVSPPNPGTTIAVSSIFPDSTGWVECKVIKGRNYYYLRSESSPQRYLGSTWGKALDRLPSFLGERLPL